MDQPVLRFSSADFWATFLGWDIGTWLDIPKLSLLINCDISRRGRVVAFSWESFSSMDQHIQVKQNGHIDAECILKHILICKVLWFALNFIVFKWPVNYLRPSDKCMHSNTRLPLAQIMAWHLFDTKPLSEPMLEYCWLDP